MCKRRKVRKKEWEKERRRRDENVWKKGRMSGEKKVGDNDYSFWITFYEKREKKKRQE